MNSSNRTNEYQSGSCSALSDLWLHHNDFKNGYAEQKSKDYLNSYSADQLLSLKGDKYTSNLDKKTFLIIKELGMKRNFRGLRGGRDRQRIQDQNNGIHKRWLRPLPKHNIVQWKGKDTRFFLTNTQSLINKLDMILHHMEVDKIDIGFISETWINNTIDQELVISQRKNAGYTIISHEHERLRSNVYL